MLMEIFNDFFSCFIAALGGILISKNLLNGTIHDKKVTTILSIIIYTLVMYYTYNEEYIPLQTILKCLTFTLIIKRLFDVKIATAFTTSIIVFIILMISEILLMINPYLMKNIILIRSNVLLFTITNSIVMLIGYLISKINFIRKLVNIFIDKLEKNSKRNELIVLIILISSLAFFCYLIFLNRNIEINNTELFVFIVILCIFFYVHIYEKNKYNNLIDRYNNLLEYAYTYEEKLENDKLLRHEHKNQLAVIKGMSKNKKVINYIDSLLKNNKTDTINIKGINNLPKGGLRGLVYYKICLIAKKKINYNVDISRNVKKSFNELSDIDRKNLSYIIGVYLDNAIEECESEKENNISIEIYMIEEVINIIISNTLHNRINLNKLGEKGYTTKGKNHGNGLFLVNKLIKESLNISSNTKIINNFFVQEIKVDTKKMLNK